MADNPQNSLDWLTKHLPALPAFINALGAGGMLYAGARVMERVLPSADKRLDAAQARRNAQQSREESLAKENAELRRELEEMTALRTKAERETIDYQRRLVQAESAIELIRKNAEKSPPSLADPNQIEAGHAYPFIRSQPAGELSGNNPNSQPSEVDPE